VRESWGAAKIGDAMFTIDSLGLWFPQRGFHRQRVVGFRESEGSG
jgi:hypothetical protein